MATKITIWIVEMTNSFLQYKKYIIIHVYIIYNIFIMFFFSCFHNYVSKLKNARRAIFPFSVTYAHIYNIANKYSFIVLAICCQWHTYTILIANIVS